MHAFTFPGRWCYAEYDFLAGPGSSVYEQAGATHTFIVPGDNNAEVEAAFVVEGGNVNYAADGCPALLVMQDGRCCLPGSPRSSMFGICSRVVAPTVVMHNRDNAAIPAGHGRYVAEHIPGARYIEFEGTDHVFQLESPEPVLIELEAFVTGHRPLPEPERVLALVVFTDLVGAAAVGDNRRRDTRQLLRAQPRHPVHRRVPHHSTGTRARGAGRHPRW